MSYNLSPLDSRYKDKVETIAECFSDEELTIKRFIVMRDYLEFIYNELTGGSVKFDKLHRINRAEIHREALEIEKETKHDVKAIEYLIRNKIDEKYWPYIHFGLTSNDVNSVAYTLMIRNGVYKIYSQAEKLVDFLHKFGFNHFPMLSHTHGQPATPTTFYFTMKVFIERIQNELKCLPDDFTCKFGGATGGLNTLVLVQDSFENIKHEKYEDVGEMMDSFLHYLYGLKRNKYTTQIDHYDNYSRIFDSLKRLNVILLDFVTDMWQYIHMGYIKQRPVEGEVGSSTMPHKINPIHMENAEGNLHLANALFECFSRKLPNSRMQRDLSDSTILRNIGVAFGHTYLAIKSIMEGLTRYVPNNVKMDLDLDSHWEILGEAVQTVLRLEGKSDAYEIIKKYTRNGSGMNNMEYLAMISELPLSPKNKDKLLKLTPWNYLGYP